MPWEPARSLRFRDSASCKEIFNCTLSPSLSREDVGDDQAEALAVLDRLGFLLRDALLLGIAVAVAQVAPHDAAGG